MTTSAAAPGLRILDLPLALRPDVETIVGADHASMLFDPVTGRYTRVGAGTVRLLESLDGTITGRQIADQWSQASGRLQQDVSDRLALVLGELAQAGMLAGTADESTDDASSTSTFGPAARNSRKNLARTLHRTPTATFAIITTALPRLVGPLAGALRIIPSRVRIALAVVIAATGLVSGISLLITHPLPMVITPYLIAVAVVLLQTVVHEFWHAIICVLHGVTPRELGVALWYGFMPIAYVDRTDSYRLPGRGGRVAICIAGPVQDLGWVAIYTALALTVDGVVGQVAHVAVVLALYLVLFNLNPLLPTDGQQAVEAATGEVNFRGRAMAYLGHLLLRVPLPSYLIRVSRGRRYGYLAYGGLCAAYLLVMVTLLLVTAVSAIRGLGSML